MNTVLTTAAEIKAKLHELGLTQVKAAALCGMRGNNLNMYLNEKLPLTHKVLRQINLALAAYQPNPENSEFLKAQHDADICAELCLELKRYTAERAQAEAEIEQGGLASDVVEYLQGRIKGATALIAEVKLDLALHLPHVS